MELTIAVAVLTILTTLAYPTYEQYHIRVGRTEGKLALLQMAAGMENYFSSHKTYQGATSPAVLGLPEISNGGMYRLSVGAVTDKTYTLIATPMHNRVQAKDASCSPLTLTQSHVLGPNKACWE